MLCRRGDFRAAADYFKKALSSDAENAKLRTNFGITLLEKGSAKTAVKELKKAVLNDNSLVLAHLGLARAFGALSQNEKALESFLEVLRYAPDNFVAVIGAATLLDNFGKKEEAAKYFEYAHKIAPDNISAQVKLATFDFKQGLMLFQQSDFNDAFRIWGISYRRYPLPYNTHQTITADFNALVSKFNTSDALATKKTELVASLKDKLFAARPLYDYVNLLLLSLALIPEAQ